MADLPVVLATDPPFELLGDKIAVTKDPTPDRVGMIELPEKARRRPSSGLVVSTGPNCPDYLSLGVRVIFNQAAGTAIRVDEQAYLILTPDEVLAWLPWEVSIAPDETS